MSLKKVVFGALFLAQAVWAGSAAIAQSPERGTLLTHGITGSSSQSGRRDPGYLLRQAAVQSAIIEASRGPLPEERVAELLGAGDASVEDLVATGILKPAGESRYGLALNYYSTADQALIRDVAAELSHSLAAAFVSERDGFETLLSHYDLADADHHAVAMALIGAVVLDWDGLGVTAAGEYRLPTVQQATGDYYVPWARERGPESGVRALYWGSHNADIDGITLTTFGDHHSLPRIALPDMFFSIGKDELVPHLPEPVRSALLWPARSQWDEMQSDAARIMIRLRAGSADATALAGAVGREPDEIRRTLQLLEAVHYIRKEGDLYAASIPVFTAQDAPLIEQVRAEGRRIMEAWLQRNHPVVRRRLAELTAVKAGVPFEQLFTQIWHDMFGWANYRLVQQGLLIDPYGPRSLYEGFQPFVWETSLDLQSGTRVGRPAN